MSYTSKVKVQAAAKNIDMNGGRTATLTDAEVNYYLQWTDDIINSKLSVVYYVPLNNITMNNITMPPPPIEYIATQIAAGLMVESTYARIEPQISDAGKAHKDNAFMELDQLCEGVIAGSRFLQGQIRKARNSFIDPYIMPPEPPKGRSYS